LAVALIFASNSFNQGGKIMAKRICVIIFMAVLLCVFECSISEAIPYFARKYETSCSTCHVIIPKLNSFGIAFKNNGYRMPQGEEEMLKEKEVKLGSEAYKRVWPKAIWPGAIPGNIPLSMHIMSRAEYAPDEDVKFQFEFPHEVEFMTGGTLGESFSFLGEITIEEGGIEVERYHINWDSIGDNTLFNLKAGYFEIGAVPFSRFSKKLTLSDYALSNWRAISGGFRFRSRQSGIELWGANSGKKGGGLEWAAGIVNGTGEPMDEDNNKDFYGRIAYKIGGMGLTGAGESINLEQVENWRDNSIKLGVFGYKGKSMESDFNRFGVDFDLFYQDLNIYGAFMRGKDKIEIGELTTDAFFVEADYVFYPWLIGVVRYDNAKTKNSEIINEVKDVVASAVFAIRANIRFVAEHQHFLDNTGNNITQFNLDFLF